MREYVKNWRYNKYKFCLIILTFALTKPFIFIITQLIKI